MRGELFAKLKLFTTTTNRYKNDHKETQNNYKEMKNKKMQND